MDVVPGNVDEILQILSRRFEETWPITIRTEESTPSNTSTTDWIASVSPQEPQLFRFFVMELQIAEKAEYDELPKPYQNYKIKHTCAEPDAGSVLELEARRQLQ